MAIASWLQTQAPGNGPGAARAQVWNQFRVPAGSHPHDVAPARDGTVRFTAQTRGSSAG
jgi:virginiamycin B lyase